MTCFVNIILQTTQWFNPTPLHRPEQRLQTVDCKDTFLDADHVVQSFPQYNVQFQGGKGGDARPAPPYRITFPPSGPRPLPAALSALSRVDGSSVAADAPNAPTGEGSAAAVDGGSEKEILTVEPYTPQDPGPYPQNQPPQNKVRFTPVQVGIPHHEQTDTSLKL